MLVWMDEAPLVVDRPYFFKHTTNLVSGSESLVEHRLDMDSLQPQARDTLRLNDVGRVVLNLNRPLIVDTYSRSPTFGSFIMIDRVTNATVAAGMVVAHGADYQNDSRAVAHALTGAQRAARFHQRPTVLWCTGRAGVGKIVVARTLERRLFDAGHFACVLDPDEMPHVDRNATGDDLRPLVEHARLCVSLGLVTIVCFSSPRERDRTLARERIGGDATFLELYFDASPASCRARLISLGRDPDEAVVGYQAPEDPDITVRGDELEIETEVDRIIAMLERRGLIAH
jgi:bifunctional enzyme CysN/CysC